MTDNSQRESAAQEQVKADDDSSDDTIRDDSTTSAPPDPREPDVESDGEGAGAASGHGDQPPEAAEGAGSSQAAAMEQGGVTMAAPVDRSEGEAKSVQAARKAHLTLSRIEPWPVMRFSFVISLVCFIVLFVAVAVIYVILSTFGVFEAVTDLLRSLTDGGEGDELTLHPEDWFSASRVLGYTGILGALNIVLITALSTVAAMLYNLAADLVGGIDVTLSESE
ncbi:DUF3566 domain-containing protein [Salinactinospora qingdaonensis]